MADMNKPKDLTEALNLVPEYVMLRPGVDKWQAGDEYRRDGKWEEAFMFGKKVHPAEFGRRFIPQEVREAFAVIALAESHPISVHPVDSVNASGCVGKWLLSQGGKE